MRLDSCLVEEDDSELTTMVNQCFELKSKFQNKLDSLNPPPQVSLPTAPILSQIATNNYQTASNICLPKISIPVFL